MEIGVEKEVCKATIWRGVIHGEREWLFFFFFFESGYFFREILLSVDNQATDQKLMNQSFAAFTHNINYSPTYQLFSYLWTGKVFPIMSVGRQYLIYFLSSSTESNTQFPILKWPLYQKFYFILIYCIYVYYSMNTNKSNIKKSKNKGQYLKSENQNRI